MVGISFCIIDLFLLWCCVIDVKKRGEKIYLLIIGLFWDGCKKYENLVIFGVKLCYIVWVYSKILKFLFVIFVIINVRYFFE